MNAESPAVKAHLDIMQGVIQRMAANSASCKTWCISLVCIALLPTVMFFCLDTYYLAFEKGFRDSYKEFVLKVHGETVSEKDLFLVAPAGNLTKHQWKAMGSMSVWGFYGLLAVLIGLAIASIG